MTDVVTTDTIMAALGSAVAAELRSNGCSSAYSQVVRDVLGSMTEVELQQLLAHDGSHLIAVRDGKVVFGHNRDANPLVNVRRVYNDLRTKIAN